MNYRAEIDGLRAVAVVSVILYHAQLVILGKDWFEGGFIGVDVFFVISGYLITRIILTELMKTNTFSFVDFYDKRSRRILPMLILVIAACMPFAWQILLPSDLVAFSKSALSAMTFSSNFFFYYSTTEYGADSSFLKPLLHTWSLSVEEQFYIVAPIILLMIWKFYRDFLPTILLGVLLISLQFSDVMEGRNLELNFFLPFSRFWELLIGSIVAFIELRHGRPQNFLLKQTLPIIGVFFIAHSILFFDANTPHPSFQTLVPVIGVALILLFCTTEDLVGKILSFQPIVGVGIISYSLYLWHFPIFAYLRLNPTAAAIYEKIFWGFAILVLSIFSYFFIEKPFRNRRLISGKWFLSTSLILFSTLIYLNYNFVINDGYKDRLPPILSKQNLDEKAWKFFKQDGVDCFSRKSNFCSIKNGADLTSIYAIGDSHLSSLSQQLVSSVGNSFNYFEMNFGLCPFALNVNALRDGNLKDVCSSEFQKLRMQEIEDKPSVVLVGGRFPAYLSQDLFDNMEGGVEEGPMDSFESITNTSFEEEFIKTLKLVLAKGHHIVLLYPIPEVGVNVPSYIFDVTRGKSISEIDHDFKPLTTSYDVYKKRTESTFELFDSIKSPNVHRVYPQTLFCNKQIKDRCVTHDNINVFYADDDHPSATGSEMIVGLIMEQIHKADKIIKEN